MDAAEHRDGDVGASGALAPDPSCPDAAFWCGPARIGELAEAIRASEDADARPDLWMVHATTPHLPWLLTPTGEQYLPRSLDTLSVDGLGSDNAWGDDEVAVLERVGLSQADVEDMYRIMAIANYEDRFVIPSTHREYAENAFNVRGGCGFSFGNGCSDGVSNVSLFGAEKKRTIPIKAQI